MQQFLRGRALYVLLIALVAWLYGRAIFTGQAIRPLQGEGSFASHPAMERWPKDLDVSALQRMAKEKPLLARLVSFLSALTTALVLVGVGITAWGVATGRARAWWRFPAARLPVWSLQELGRIVVLMLLVASLMPFVRMALMGWQPQWELDIHLWVPVSMAALDVFVILTVLAFAEGKKTAPALKAIGLSTSHWRESVGVGLRSYVTVFPWLLLLLYIVVELARVLHWQPPTEPIYELVFGERRPGVFAVTVVLACLIGPVAEECLFRGVLYPALRRHAAHWLAMLVSGGLFAAIHTNPIGFLPIMMLGVLLAYIYERSGSLVGSVIVHVLHNSLLMAVAVVVRSALNA